MKIDALATAHFRHLGIELCRALAGTKFAGPVVAAVHTLFGHIRIELEGQPRHADGLLIDQCQRPFEPALPDQAPRTDHIDEDHKIGDGFVHRNLNCDTKRRTLWYIWPSMIFAATLG